MGSLSWLYGIFRWRLRLVGRSRVTLLAGHAIGDGCGDLGARVWSVPTDRCRCVQERQGVGRSESVACPARAGAIAGAHCIRSRSAHLSRVEHAHMLEMASLAVRAAARRWGRRRGRTISCCRDWVGSLLFRPCDARVIECQLLTGARCMIAPGVMPEPRVADL